MRYLLWLARIVLFLLLLGFAMKNSEPVVVRYYFGQEWQGPLVFVLLICFCAGAALGIVAALGQIFRQRREILELKRELRAQSRSTGEPPVRTPEVG
jgi:putative membrane protein